MLILRFPHGAQPRLAGRVVLHDSVYGVAPAGKIGVLNEIHDRFPVREIPTAAKERGTAQQTWVEASFPGYAVEQTHGPFLKSGVFGQRIEQPVREVDLRIVFHLEPPIPGRRPVQMHGHYGRFGSDIRERIPQNFVFFSRFLLELFVFCGSGDRRRAFPHV